MPVPGKTDIRLGRGAASVPGECRPELNFILDFISSKNEASYKANYYRNENFLFSKIKQKFVAILARIDPLNAVFQTTRFISFFSVEI